MNTLQLRWIDCSYIEYITVALNTLRLHWIHYGYIEYNTVALNTLRLHWIHYGYIEYNTSSLNTLQLHRVNYSYIKYITVTLNWWCTEFIWSTSVYNARARYCLNRRTSPCESRHHFDVQTQYLAAAAAVFCVLFCRKSVIRTRRREQTVFFRTVCETRTNCVEFEWGPFLERITALACLSELPQMELLQSWPPLYVGADVFSSGNGVSGNKNGARDCNCTMFLC